MSSVSATTAASASTNCTFRVFKWGGQAHVWSVSRPDAMSTEAKHHALVLICQESARKAPFEHTDTVLSPHHFRRGVIRTQANLSVLSTKHLKPTLTSLPNSLAVQDFGTYLVKQAAA